MLTNQDEIRERIIQIRKERGVSQNQLAKTLEFPERITAT